MANRKSTPGAVYDALTRSRLEKHSVLVPFSGCRIWLGAHFPYGYGKLGYLGRVLGAHRVSYMVNVGEIPDGMFVCHICDVPACVNHHHLFLGSQQENMDDMVRKGRAPKPRHEGPLNPMFGRTHSDSTVEKMRLLKEGLYVGSKHPRATINEEVAWRISKMKGLTTREDVASQFGVSMHVVANIWRGKTWRNVCG